MFYLKDVKLSNFRCYESYYQEFSPNINIIIGDNAVGKTSLIESVYVLAVTKSHKSTSDMELIKYNADFCFVKGTFIDDKKTEVVFSLSSKGKQIVKNAKKVKHLSEYVGFFYVVMFCPEDLELIKGAPSSRRKFLDINISQLNNNYLESLIKYKKILKDRNLLLKDLAENKRFDSELLPILTEQLVNEGKKIVSFRKEFIARINKFFMERVKSISNNKEIVRIEYCPSCDEENMSKAFKEKEKLDLLTKTTNCGPHRDDFVIYFNDKETCYASQGQQRTFALALELALIDLIKEKSDKIIVVLDDVFGELDIQRQKELIKLLEIEYQIFITTTSIDHLDDEILKNSKVIKINKDGE